MGSVAKHDVKQEHCASRIGSLLRYPFEAQRLVDHRMWSSRGQPVVTKIDHEMARRMQVSA